jgi:hypothetical protein
MSRDIKHLFASRVSDNLLAYKGTSGLTVTSTRFEIVSTMRAAIFWRNSLGLTVIEAPAASPSAAEGFYVNITYEFEQGVKIDARELINELRVPENSAVRKELYAALQNLESKPAWGVQRNFKYTLGISRQELDDANGVVYLRDLDLVVGYERYCAEALHPYTNAGVLSMLSDTVDRSEKGFFQRYLLVDNNQRGGSRWINTWFGVYELKPISDPQLEDGVYVIVKDQSHAEPQTTHLKMEDAVQQLGLYVSRLEAETFGRPDKLFEAELKQHERELLQEKADFAQLKQTLEREKHDLQMDRERHDSAVKAEEHRMRMERDRFDEQVKRQEDRAARERDQWKAEQDTFTFERKRRFEREQYDYEDRSRERKEESEYVKAGLDIAKAVLGILTVSLSIYAVMQKSKK